MVDKDMSEINALNDVFPESDVLLCWYHVLQVRHFFPLKYCILIHNVNDTCIIRYICPGSQAIVRWLMKSDSSVSGPQRSSIRKEIIDYFKKMKACPMVFEFYILMVVLYGYNMYT